jgi:hypothetical protein
MYPVIPVSKTRSLMFALLEVTSIF